MFKKSEKKKLVSNSKIQTAFKEPISQKSPQNSTFNHYPSSPPFLKNKPNQQKKNAPQNGTVPGVPPPELQGHPASSSSNPSPSTATFPRSRALPRPPEGLDPIIWGWESGGMVRLFHLFFSAKPRGMGDFFLRVFLGFFKGEGF